GVLSREVVALARVALGVEELPALLVEVAPRLRSGRHGRRRLPAAVPDRPRAEHGVELRLLARVRVRVGEARGEADPLDGLLRVALDLVGRLDPEALVERRDDVDRVRELRSQLAGRGDALRPADDQRVGGAAAIAAVALPELEGRVERPRP